MNFSSSVPTLHAFDILPKNTNYLHLFLTIMYENVV